MDKEIGKFIEKYPDLVDDQIIFLDSDCKILYINKAAKERFSKGKSSIGNSCTDYCKFKDYNPGECPAKEAERTKQKQTVEIEYEMGNTYSVSVYPIIKNEKITGFVEVSRDITNRKQVEQELLKSETLYRTLFDVLGTANAIVDKDHRIKFTNLKMEELTSYTKDELKDKIFEHFLTPEEIIENLIMKSIEHRDNKNQEPAAFESKIIDKYGIEHSILSYIDSIPETDDSIISVLDITKIKKAQELQRQAYVQIVNNIQEFANLIDGIRNPLSVIQGASDLVSINFSEIINKQIEKISQITDQIDQRWIESDKIRNTLIEQLEKL